MRRKRFFWKKRYSSRKGRKLSGQRKYELENVPSIYQEPDSYILGGRKEGGGSFRMMFQMKEELGEKFKGDHNN